MVGYYVGKSWNLPRYLCEAIHEHHQVEKPLPMNTPMAAKNAISHFKMAEHIVPVTKPLANKKKITSGRALGKPF